jgi:hypothetical protein
MLPDYAIIEKQGQAVLNSQRLIADLHTYETATKIEVSSSFFPL